MNQIGYISKCIHWQEVAIIYGRSDSERQFINSLPNEVHKIEDIGKVKKEFEKKLAKKDSGFFAGIRKWNYKRQIGKFDKHCNGAFHLGANGENKVIEELAKLDDKHYVLCGLSIALPYYVRHRNQKNLRSAQMDIVVVCPKGVFMIEVKNWSNDYLENNDKLNPYEQTERAGKILWITLQNINYEINVTNVLCSLKGNIKYNRIYRSVMVTQLQTINNFIEKQQTVLSQQKVIKIADYLQDYLNT